ncbi:MAG: hypothetical protein ABW007_20100 [Chitinophagaceae bacterium]
MKNWRRFFQWLFIRHLAAFEEELYPQAVHQPAPCREVLRCSLNRHFRIALPSQPYLLAFDSGYDLILEDLCSEGWVVELKVDRDGDLTYGIVPKQGVAPVSA